MKETKSRIAWIMVALCVMSAQATTAEPLDLRDPTPRWIEVRFEVSPSNEPGRLDGSWSAVRLAYLDRDLVDNMVRIRIPQDEIEAQLRSVGTETVHGSFSDFVWTMDPGSGHVVNAELSGRVRERLSLGPITTAAVVAIRVQMTTQGASGFRPTRRILGSETNPFCAPPGDAAGCVVVPPIRFKPESGYVNAVGSVVAAASVAKIRAFSPLGEVKFSERGPIGAKAALSGALEQDGVCSDVMDGPCLADLGGES